MFFFFCCRYYQSNCRSTQVRAINYFWTINFIYCHHHYHDCYRPDFFSRCFPDGIMNSELNCTGEYWSVIDGRKSFPSGHSSFSFATLGFLTFYLMGKLKIFSDEGRGKSCRLIFCFVPLIVAMLIGKRIS